MHGVSVRSQFIQDVVDVQREQGGNAQPRVPLEVRGVDREIERQVELVEAVRPHWVPVVDLASRYAIFYGRVAYCSRCRQQLSLQYMQFET